MSVSIFRYGRRLGTSIRLPITYREKASWQPQVNDRFPDFTAVTTRGSLSLHEWARGCWVYLMSHPAAFTPVCSTELGELAKRAAEFDERNVRIIALTRDSVEQIGAWTRQIEAIYDARVSFPHIADPEGVISRACGLVSREAEWNGRMCARRTYLIDPKGVIRAIFDYPLAVGRSVDEALRTIDALQIASNFGAFTPGEWKLGEPLLVADEESEGGLKRFIGRQVRTFAPYLKLVDLSSRTSEDPRKKASGTAAPATSARSVQRKSVMARLLPSPEGADDKDLHGHLFDEGGGRASAPHDRGPIRQR